MRTSDVVVVIIVVVIVIVVVVVILGLKSWERIEMQPQIPIQSAVCNNYDRRPLTT